MEKITNAPVIYYLTAEGVLIICQDRNSLWLWVRYCVNQNKTITSITTQEPS